MPVSVTDIRSHSGICKTFTCNTDDAEYHFTFIHYTVLIVFAIYVLVSGFRKPRIVAFDLDDLDSAAGTLQFSRRTH